MITGRTHEAGSVIDNDGFWPDIDSQAVARLLALTPGVPRVRLEQAVLNAMSCVNRELRLLKQRYRAEGYNSLAQVPVGLQDGQDHWLRLYRRALCCAVGSELCERYAKAPGPTRDQYCRGQRIAVGHLLSVAIQEAQVC